VVGGERVKLCQTTTRSRSCALSQHQRDRQPKSKIVIGERTSFIMDPVTWTALSHESLIGPPSALVNIDDFLRGARDNSTPVFNPSAPLQPVPDGVDPDAIVSECRWVAHISYTIIP
jgi:hypothetical protein